MRCLVLGGTGFLGGHLVQTLRAEGHEVRAFARRWPGGFIWDPSGVDWYVGDFTARGELGRALDDCDVVFHLIGAACPASSDLDPVEDLEANLVATVRMLDLACERRVKKIVFPSSGGTVYGVASSTPISERHPTEPVCSYGIHKLAIEKYLRLYQRLHGLDYCILRLANAFGERQAPNRAQGAVAVFVARALAGESIGIWGDGSVVRDYVHVEDVSRAFCLAATSRSDMKIFNIGTGNGRSVEQIVSAIETVLGRPVARRYMPARVCDVPVSVLDASAAAEHLGWRPQVSFEEGLRRTIVALRAADHAIYAPR